MKRPIRSVVALLLLIMPCAMLMAQSKQFKNEWKKLLEPMYFSSDVKTDGMPEGDAKFGIYGFSGSTDYKAPFDLSGTIKDRVKGDKEYTFSLSNAKLAAGEGANKFEYNGNLVFDISWSKSNKCPVLSIIFTGGRLTTGGKEYALKKEWSKSVGTLETNLPAKVEGMPRVAFTLSSINLPTVENRSIKAPSALLQQINKGTAELSDADQRFFNAVMSNGDPVTALPDYTESHTVLRSNGKLIDDELASSSLGNTIVMKNITAVRNGNFITVSIKDTKGFTDCAAVFKFDEDSPESLGELVSVKWEPEGAGVQYNRGTLVRGDGSKLTGIEFNRTRSQSTQGYVLRQISALEKLSDPKVYEFSDLANTEGVSVKKYVSEKGNQEDIENNTVMSLERAARAAATEEAEWRSKGYMEITDMFIGSAADSDYVWLVEDKLYDIDIKYLCPVARIKSHTHEERSVPVEVKVYKGDVLITTYDYDVTIFPLSEEITFGGYGSEDYSLYDAGKYRFDVMCNGSKIASKEFTVHKKPASATVYDVDINYNAVSESGNHGMRMTYSLDVEGMRGKTVKVYFKMYRADGKTPARYAGKNLVIESTRVPSYDSSTWTNQWFFYTNRYMRDALGTKYGELKFKIEVRDSSGKLLTQTRLYSICWY